MRFTAPLALLLLLLLPAAAALGWPARGYGRRREIISLALRLVLLLCLILSLAGLELRQNSDNLAVVFLIDISDSMPETAQVLAADYVRQAMQAMGPEDQAAVIAFGGDALVERAMSPSQALDAVTSIPTTNQTDLAEAIRLAMALYPPDAARRMVILSDGAATTGNAAEAARLAAAAGVEIVVVPFVISPGPEVLVSDVSAPALLSQGESFDLSLTIEANQAALATLRVFSGGQLAYEGQYALDRGSQTLSLPLVAGEPGFASYQVQVVTENDTYYQNNEMAAFSHVQGPPRVLVVAPPAGEALSSAPDSATRPDEFTALLNALQAAGFIYELVRPAQMPSELPTLAEYAAVVLIDVPARQLSNRQMESLQTYVRDLGGGLVSVGGPTSYGVGGYYHTPLEETLPVDMQIKDEERRPDLAIVFIIDHSGSMADTSGGASKLDLAKEAAIRSVGLLMPMDRVGVIAFDDTAQWVVQMTDMSDPQAVTNAIGSIRLGGGTDILAGLQAMAAVLPSDPANIKHVILLTDGGADPTGIPELVENLYNEYGITLTTIGVGQDAAPFLPVLAELGGGRYHFADNPASIPSIFTEETTLATRSYIIEETFYPQVASNSPILSGITETPPLYGYVGTSAKETAQTILVSHLGDPILAAWQYGLGRAVSFTSDATGRWAQDWLNWQGFPAFWAQAVRYVLSDQSFSPLEVQIEHSGETARLVVEAAERSTDGSVDYFNGYTLQANIIPPSGETISVTLQQVAPGAYEAAFIPTGQGAYLVRVSGQPAEEGGQALGETAGWVLSYSPEYRFLESDPQALYLLAAANGGRLAGEDPAQAFEHTLTARRAARPLWPALLTLAALLLPLDIAVRRLVLTRGDLQRLGQHLRQGIRLPARLAARSSAISAPARPEQMDQLLQAKQRTRQARIPAEPAPQPLPPSPPPAQPAAPPSGPVPPAAPPPQAGKEPPGTTAAQLLARKRSRKNEREQ